MYKTRKNLLPYNREKMSQEREGGYNIRAKSDLKTPKIHTTKKKVV